MQRTAAAAFAWQAQYTEPPGGRRSTQSLWNTYQTSHSSLLTYHCHHSCQASLTAPLLTPHLSHLTHHFSLTIVMDHSLSCQASLTAPLLTTSRGRRSTQSLLEELRRAWSPLGPRLPFYGARGRRWGPGCLSRCRRSTQSLLEELRRPWSPLGPRLPLAWQAQYTEPPGGAAARVVAAEAAAAFHVAGTQSLLEELRGAWSPLHGAAVAFRVAGAVHRASWRSCGARGRRWGRGCLSRGRRSTPLITCHSSLLTYHCHHSCQASLTAPLLTPHLSHLTHHFSLTIVTTHVKHHSPLHFSPSRVAGAVPQSLLEELRRAWLPLGPRLPFAWQAQYTPLITCHSSLLTCHCHHSCQAITHRSTSHPPLITSHSSLLTYHCHHSCQASLTAPLLTISRGRRSNRASWSGRRWGRGCLSRGRRSTQSLLEELRRAWSPLGPRLPFCGARGHRWGRGCLSRGRRSTQSLLEELRRAWSPLGPRLPFAWQAQYTTYRMSLITSHLPLSPLMSSTHRSTSHPPLITSHPSLLTYHCHHSCQASLTAPLLTISRGRRSTQSLLEELRRAWSPLGPRLPFACGAGAV